MKSADLFVPLRPTPISQATTRKSLMGSPRVCGRGHNLGFYCGKLVVRLGQATTGVLDSRPSVESRMPVAGEPAHFPSNPTKPTAFHPQQCQ
jgi:hypothetical protein